ncbi:SRPBCC family protein [Aureimonas psammosilenae]|uniref:SRPBCC family protein n=1 Tax=Aureimonas psammosilenae TaxID=2495496 RepID=UPI0012607CB4
MDLKGEYRLPAPRQVVWEALNDEVVLQACIPGCDSLQRLSDTVLAVEATAKVSLLKARFTGEVRLENVRAPESYRIVGEGKGGIAGFAKGAADVVLTEDGAETILRYSVDAEVGGRIAQIGGKFIGAAAARLSEKFFDRFAAHVAGEHAKAVGETRAIA